MRHKRIIHSMYVQRAFFTFRSEWDLALPRCYVAHSTNWHTIYCAWTTVVHFIHNSVVLAVFGLFHYFYRQNSLFFANVFFLQLLCRLIHKYIYSLHSRQLVSIMMKIPFFAANMSSFRSESKYSHTECRFSCFVCNVY